MALGLLLLFVPQAPAAPTHPPDPAKDIGGLNHACGVAIDSEGNLYAASAGESKVKVFDSSHAEIASISNSNEPCGLAVNSKGEVFAVERATGNVVRYKPTGPYPFVGAPSYGSAEVIDGSGQAEGISVDPFDDRLYVANGDRVDTYGPDGVLGVNEEQRIMLSSFVTGGTFTVTFEGQTTTPITVEPGESKPTANELQAALEGLSTIGSGNVAVMLVHPPPEQGGGSRYFISFKGALGSTDVPLLVTDPAGLTGDQSVPVLGVTAGFDGHIGTGELTEARGVAAYTYKVDPENTDRYLYVADSSGDEVMIFSGPDFRILELRTKLEGPEAGEDFGFGPAGAQLAADPGNGRAEDKCVPVGEQACTAGHFFVYDAIHQTVDEFEASGELVGRLADPRFADAMPTAIAVDRSGGTDDGTLYVSSAAAAAQLLAYAPLVPPSRAPLPEPLSHALTHAGAVAVDSHGNVYVAADTLIHVYNPSGKELNVGPGVNGIEVPEGASDLAVDSTGVLYTINQKTGVLTYYTPASFPPADGTQYTRHEPPLATGLEFGQSSASIAVNPADDHLFVVTAPPATGLTVLELAAANEGSTILDPDFDGGISGNVVSGIDIDGASGTVYVSTNPRRVYAIDSGEAGNPDDEKIVARISGTGSAKGPFDGNNAPIAVDQSNGHLLVFNAGDRGVAEEYDATGAFVGEFFNPLFGEFESSSGSDVAIDNSGGSSDGNLYIANDEAEAGSHDLWAFGPLSYGEPPIAVTGGVDGLGGGEATLNGSVDPRGIALEECAFQYLGDDQYTANGNDFTGATQVSCEETPAEIGKNVGPVPVHAEIGGLGLDERYRYRVVAKNKYGQSEGKTAFFGPPLLSPRSAQSIFYDEATLRAQLDPSGLRTEYRFQYGTDETYGQNTPSEQLAPGEVPVLVTASLTGLQEGTTYHFRAIAENEVAAVVGPDLTFTTQVRPTAQSCPNAQYRTGLSAKLPDCRAYELVTPGETGGVQLFASPGSPSAAEHPTFNEWLTVPRGPTAGKRLSFFTGGALPGFEGSGQGDAYRAERASGEHPAAGWSTVPVGPSHKQAGAGEAIGLGVSFSSDQGYSAWLMNPLETFAGTLPRGSYLRTPAGFEPFGIGSLGVDLEAVDHFVSPQGAHVLFSSSAHLQPEAPPPGTRAIYDRAATGSTAALISVEPDGSSFGAGEDATFIGSTEDGEAVVFEVGGTLYLHRKGGSVEVASGPSTFAGIAMDGTRIFYEKAGAIHVFDVVSRQTTVIAADAAFVNVSADGSRVFFTSGEPLTGSEENEAGQVAQAGEFNLYAWDGAQTRLVAVLDGADFDSFGGDNRVDLGQWSATFPAARGASPTRSTPDGKVFLFQSHARLSGYENKGVGEIYRYAPFAPQGERLICVSCDPSGTPPSADAMLQLLSAPMSGQVLIPNQTEDGATAFFHSEDRLLPEDSNDVRDVYEWRAPGAPGCELPDGCLALVSSGQGEADSSLYSMTPDGHDIFIYTLERLVAADVSGSRSVYDVRVGGGIPDPPASAPCQGDACQGTGSPRPALPSPGSAALRMGESSGGRTNRSRCAKGKHRVVRRGKARCVRSRSKKRNHRAKANHHRRARR